MIMGQFSRIVFLVLVISLQSARSVPLVARSFFQPNQNQNQNGNFNQLFSNGQAVDQNGNPIFQPQNQNQNNFNQFFSNVQQNQNPNNFNQFSSNVQQNQNPNNFNQFSSNGQAVDQNGNAIQTQNQNGFGQFGQNGFFQNGNGNDQSGTNQFFGNPDSLQPGQDPNILEDMGLEAQIHPGNGGDACHDTAMAEPENDYGTTGVCGTVRNPDNPGNK